MRTDIHTKRISNLNKDDFKDLLERITHFYT